MRTQSSRDASIWYLLINSIWDYNSHYGTIYMLIKINIHICIFHQCDVHCTSHDYRYILFTILFSLILNRQVYGYLEQSVMYSYQLLRIWTITMVTPAGAIFHTQNLIKYAIKYIHKNAINWTHIQIRVVAQWTKLTHE